MIISDCPICHAVTVKIRGQMRCENCGWVKKPDPIDRFLFIILTAILLETIWVATGDPEAPLKFFTKLKEAFSIPAPAPKQASPAPVRQTANFVILPVSAKGYSVKTHDGIPIMNNQPLEACEKQVELLEYVRQSVRRPV